jgi:glyoxylase-like metal-dependent hydrolase (beta-lactamase superfamily II)
MRVERVEVEIATDFTENCYLISEGPDATQVVVVDPGAQVKKILAAVGDRTVDSIVLTHRHHDHIGALAKLARATGAEIIAHSLDAEAIADPELPPFRLLERAAFKSLPAIRTVEEGDLIAVGSGQLSVLHTPGHTIGSMCLYDEEGQKLIAGDTLFFGAVGRTDLPTGDAVLQRKSIKKLALLPDETVVHPGHDRDTSIGRERQYGYLGLADKLI